MLNAKARPQSNDAPPESDIGKERKQRGFGLGAVQFVQVEPEIWVANVVGQRDIQRKGVEPEGGLPPIRCEAVEQGRQNVAEEAVRVGASVHMPRIGCGLAGGSWDRIEPIIARTLLARGVEVFVCDVA